jgi:hypothetical protein
MQEYLEETVVFGVDLSIPEWQGVQVVQQPLCPLEQVDYVAIALLIHCQKPSALAVNGLDVQRAL